VARSFLNFVNDAFNSDKKMSSLCCDAGVGVGGFYNAPVSRAYEYSRCCMRLFFVTVVFT
jgi:hypothetical protein